jgi:hypothetical protein
LSVDVIIGIFTKFIVNFVGGVEIAITVTNVGGTCVVVIAVANATVVNSVVASVRARC